MHGEECLVSTGKQLVIELDRKTCYGVQLNCPSGSLVAVSPILPALAKVEFSCNFTRWRTFPLSLAEPDPYRFPMRFKFTLLLWGLVLLPLGFSAHGAETMTNAGPTAATNGLETKSATTSADGQSAADPFRATKENPWKNTLGMKFVPVAGAGLLFCVWETRVRDFEAFVNATGYDATKGMFSLKNGRWVQNGDNWKSPGFSQGPTHPVCGVNWEDAKAFCAWLTRREQAAGKISESQSYRLPREVEWNQAVGEGKYPWGEQWPPPRDGGNYAGSEARDADWPSERKTIEGYRDEFPQLAPAGSFKANHYGLYDLGGNVWEWCEDWYDSDQKKHGVRGAAWSNGTPENLLSSCRGSDSPDYRSYSVGFRCVLVVGGSAR